MKSIFIAVLLSFFWTGLFLVAGIFNGWITITVSDSWLMNPFAFMYRHLRMSVVPFGLLLLLYAYLVMQIRQGLASGKTDLSRLCYLDRLLNCTIAAFFGVGVIWTAIGMETALVQALDGVRDHGGSAAAAGISAWTMLERLVNGGLLLALSTTVFGGVCGYVLRLLKIMLIGSAWDRYILREEGNGQAGAPAGG